jgi:hypothetical protein
LKQRHHGVLYCSHISFHDVQCFHSVNHFSFNYFLRNLCFVCLHNMGMVPNFYAYSIQL